MLLFTNDFNYLIAFDRFDYFIAEYSDSSIPCVNIVCGRSFFSINDSDIVYSAC